MRKPYFQLWMLLALALALLVAYSALSPVEVLGFTPRQSTFYPDLTERREPVFAAVAETAKRSVARQRLLREPQRHAPDTAPKTILIIGDSMLEGLAPRLGAYAAQNGHTLYSVIWYSSSSKVWGSCNKLAEYIKQFKPDYIFVSLGSNELFVKDIAAKRDRYVKNIIKQIGDIPYVWIGPPNWKPDTGINDLIAANAKPGCFFLTNGMKFDRNRDGAHPTRASSIVWMDSVASWVKTRGRYPIKLDKPKIRTQRPKRQLILQPPKDF